MHTWQVRMWAEHGLSLCLLHGLVHVPPSVYIVTHHMIICMRANEVA